MPTFSADDAHIYAHKRVGTGAISCEAIRQLNSKKPLNSRGTAKVCAIMKMADHADSDENYIYSIALYATPK